METQPTLVCRAALWGVQFPRWILGSTETFNKVKESDGEKRRGSRSVPSVVMFVFCVRKESLSSARLVYVLKHVPRNAVSICT